MSEHETLQVGVAQIAPVWLDREATLLKVRNYIARAAEKGCRLVCFGEALVPGYPFWVERTGGARFNSATQKGMFAYYLDQGVVVERGDLDPLRESCRAGGIAAYVGVMERAPDRGGHSLYCSLVYIDPDGEIRSVHRKTQPTYEERLVWAGGDGKGLRVHELHPFRIGGLNCFENWMPLMRSALYAQGESLHVATWPGGEHNTVHLTRFLAMEARCYVVSASGLLRAEDIPAGVPLRQELLESSATFANGGSAIAGPDGQWLIEPVVAEERLITATLDARRVREERHNFDLAGHYSRPDITQLRVNRERQATAVFND